MVKRKMKDEFKGLNLYSNDSYESIWENAIIVLDTNILLNLFRYSKDTRKEFFAVLKLYKNRLWIPYQVIREYYKNRDRVIRDSAKELTHLEESIYEKLDNILEEINKYSKKIQSIDELKNIIEKTTTETKEKINNLKEKNEDELKINKEDINIESDILNLIEDKYEEKYEYSQIEEIIKEGEKRIINQIPPGYKDIDKSERYETHQINGDYLIFSSIIKFAKENKKNIIFITDDVKEDWFQDINGEKIGGRRELLQEFYEKTNQLLLIYSSEGFINNYNKRNPKKMISEEIVKEIEVINRNKEWIDNLEKGIELSNNQYYRYYSINKELSNSEKIICIKELKKELKHLIQMNRYTETKIICLEILDIIKRIEKYEIERYSSNFEAINDLKMYIIKAIERDRYYSVIRYANLILKELEKIN